MTPQQARETWRRMTSADARAVWRRVAQGERGPDVDALLKEVASKIVTEVFDPTNPEGKRDATALRIIGFRGKLGRPSKYPGLAESVAIIDSHPGPRRSARDAAEDANLVNTFPGDPSTEKIAMSVAAERKKARRK